MTLLELDGRDPAKTRMTPRGVVPTLDELEDRHPRLGLGPASLLQTLRRLPDAISCARRAR